MVEQETHENELNLRIIQDHPAFYVQNHLVTEFEHQLAIKNATPNELDKIRERLKQIFYYSNEEIIDCPATGRKPLEHKEYKNNTILMAQYGLKENRFKDALFKKRLYGLIVKDASSRFDYGIENFYFTKDIEDLVRGAWGRAKDDHYHYILSFREKAFPEEIIPTIPRFYELIEQGKFIDDAIDV